MITFNFITPAPFALRAASAKPTTNSRTVTRCTAAQPSRLIQSNAVVMMDDDMYKSALEPQGDYVFTPSDGSSFHQRVKSLRDDQKAPETLLNTLSSWYGSYEVAAERNPYIKRPSEFTELMFSTLLELCYRAVVTPHHFGSYHQHVRQPFDYYKFGLDFAGALFNPDQSTVKGVENARRAFDYVQAGHNVVFLSNHQSEGDPHAIDLLFDHIAGLDHSFGEEVISVAGDRVREDPVVIPFSIGRNILTVYSKKHMNDIPGLREQKLQHNKRSLSELTSLFKQGGHRVWVAPSGGRDRRSSETGRVEISRFDDASIDSMRFVATKSGAPCHFFPMALSTYDMLPPPSHVGGANFGEERHVNYIPMHMFVGDEINWESIVPSHVTNKLDRRRAQREHIENIVVQGYRSIGGYES